VATVNRDFKARLMRPVDIRRDAGLTHVSDSTVPKDLHESVMHTRPRDETENDRDTSRTVETAREWRDWPRMTAVSRDPARPGENLLMRILLANPAYSNNWCWTSATVVMK
jgi:hypothetical protein